MLLAGVLLAVVVGLVFGESLAGRWRGNGVAAEAASGMGEAVESLPAEPRPVATSGSGTSAPAPAAAERRALVMPSVVGLDLAGAEVTLRAHGIEGITIESVETADVGAGVVFQQSPRAGQTLDGPDGWNAAVSLFVAKTPAERASETELHPQVQAQAMEIVTSISDRHAAAWSWIGPALNASQFSFFEQLPESCSSAIGCYNHVTGDVWLSLDALRLEPDAFNRHSSSDIVLHELAHAYTRSTTTGQALLDRFSAHYAGCRLDDRDLTTSRLAAELLADTMAMSAMQSLRKPDAFSLFNGAQTDYGYFRKGGFDGCLADSREPAPQLVLDVYRSVFNCTSDHALDVFESNRTLAFNPTTDEKAILATCFGVRCDQRSGCAGWSDEDARQRAAQEAIHDRTCADGLVYPGNSILEREGWESFCGLSYVPDDVECVVDQRGDPPDPGRPSAVFPGRVDSNGMCAAR